MPTDGDAAVNLTLISEGRGVGQLHAEGAPVLVEGIESILERCGECC
jgi:hypothetical protein